jgi:hypothetical protein
MANFGAQNQLDGYENVGFDVLGRAVDMSRPDLSSGYYMYAENPEGSSCPDEMRAGQMVIKGAGRVDTCAGRIFQENLPDIYVVDYRFKTIIRLIMMASIVMLIIAIAGKI